MIIVNGFQPLTIITKRSILDVPAVLDPPLNVLWDSQDYKNKIVRAGSRTAATHNMEHFMIIVNGYKPLTIITKSSMLDVAAVLDPPLKYIARNGPFKFFFTQQWSSSLLVILC